MDYNALSKTRYFHVHLMIEDCWVKMTSFLDSIESISLEARLKSTNC
jgi:pentose-5-phosphate-3-epimerase